MPDIRFLNQISNAIVNLAIKELSIACKSCRKRTVCCLDGIVAVVDADNDAHGKYILSVKCEIYINGKGRRELLPEFSRETRKAPGRNLRFCRGLSLERPTRLELATSTLARWRSTR